MRKAVPEARLFEGEVERVDIKLNAGPEQDEIGPEDAQQPERGIGLERVEDQVEQQQAEHDHAEGVQRRARPSSSP